MFGHSLITYTPKSIAGTSLVRWYDASNPANGSQFADSSLITTWTDLAFVGNASGPVPDANKPTYKLNQQNGLPGIQFSGNQVLTSASLNCGSNLTLFVVSISSNNSLFMEQSADINVSDGFYIYGPGGNAGQIRNGGNYASVTVAANWLGTSCNLAMIRYDGTNMDAWKNGAQVATAAQSISNTTVTDTWYIGARGGASLFMTGNLYEVLLYNIALSNAQVALINDYLRRKWAIY